ncbi:hypothetical protein BCON_0365g00070 [Botryotinia convoluta]|uniref:Uncharacterized protein n=1 Tax=Botryotinia convoluta TaxID=54673 RepID=A0A4Z1HAF1_9HELO|nr:hypothetical protein BCON_0365g00070 [Botryotinia convoluta]
MSDNHQSGLSEPNIGFANVLKVRPTVGPKETGEPTIERSEPIKVTHNPFAFQATRAGPEEMIPSSSTVAQSQAVFQSLKRSVPSDFPKPPRQKITTILKTTEKVIPSKRRPANEESTGKVTKSISMRYRIGDNQQNKLPETR